MSEQEHLYDCIIIGGGPAGLSAAQYLSRLALKTVVLDKSKTAGALAFTNKIENYPGITKPLTGAELLDIFRAQAVTFGAEYVESQVIGALLDNPIKEVFTMEGVYKGRSVIIATGAMGRKPSFKGEKEFLGRGVSYCAVCDAAFYKDKTVCIVGESDEAVKETFVLRRFTDKVSLIAQTDNRKLRDNPQLIAQDIKVLINKRIEEIRGSEIVESIVLVDKLSNEQEILPMDGVFMYLHGNTPIVDFLNFAVDISDDRCVITNRMMETNLEGVFAAGDVTCVEVRQVLVAASNGCVAALSAEKYLHHRKRRKYVWG
ncbi:NAD(P)/FAD-dependent oxidoreductase [Candidatus Magnetomonas plexicatena]|uniref:NAD(P)/FAD-dependent oxidoreductase n=1 Tax=Candidatus Magnetomonas plexicatena TaxID=2552947 RepID=UPI001C7674F9|nr:FAD-dependent oxidoreductase [Nitrospirales bacterium LBB_01]